VADTVIIAKLVVGGFRAAWQQAEESLRKTKTELRTKSEPDHPPIEDLACLPCFIGCQSRQEIHDD